MHAGGLSISSPPPTKLQSPDYLIRVGASNHGLEVKRPTKAGNISAAVRQAYNQLRDYDIDGGVAIDVSDCLEDSLLFSQEADRSRPPYELISNAFGHLYHQVSDRLFHALTRRPKREASRIFFAVVYLHGWRWFRKGPTGPELYSATQFGRFVATKGNLRYWTADSIREAFLAGLKRTGLYVVRETEEIL
jgi:hypothetical protein